MKSAFPPFKGFGDPLLFHHAS